MFDVLAAEATAPRAETVTDRGGAPDVRTTTCEAPVVPGGAWSADFVQRLDHLRPVPRTLVHRAAMAEVFLTDTAPIGEDHFLVAAQWPRDHALYYPDPLGRTDPLLIAETLRQSLVYLSHEYYDVPLGYRFVAYDMDFEITDPAPLRVRGVPHSVVLDVRCVRVGHRPPRRHGLRLEAELTVDGKVCGRAGIRFIALDERTYQVLRSRSTPYASPVSLTGDAVRTGPGGAEWETVPPTGTGRLRAKDCVLERSAAGEWRMRIDTDHAILFDHPTDHLPMMASLEGFRQLGHLLVNGGSSDVGAYSLVSCTTDCRLFVELDAPVSLVVRDDRHDAGTRRLTVDAVQCGKVVTTADLVWAENG